MISLIIPALNNFDQILNILNKLSPLSSIDDIVIIDRGSTDQTLERLRQKGLRAFLGLGRGKGSCFSRGLSQVKNDIVVYLDPEMSDVDAGWIGVLTSPLVNDQSDFTLMTLEETVEPVTDMTVLPLLRVFFPETQKVSNPLPKMFAGHRSLLQKIKIDADNPFTVGLVIDLTQLAVRINEFTFSSHSPELPNLIEQKADAQGASRIIIERAAKFRRVQSHMVTDSIDQDIEETMTPLFLAKKINPEKPILLITPDRTIIHGLFLDAFMQYAGLFDEYSDLNQGPQTNEMNRLGKIARLMNGVPRYIFEKVAKTIPLRPHVPETILSLKSLGYQIGIISDGFSLPCEILRSRIFADFIIANTLNFKRGTCTGHLNYSPAFFNTPSTGNNSFCMSHTLSYLRQHLQHDSINFLAIGTGSNDRPLLKQVTSSFILASKPTSDPSPFTPLSRFNEILQHLPSSSSKARSPTMSTY